MFDDFDFDSVLETPTVVRSEVAEQEITPTAEPIKLDLEPEKIHQQTDEEEIYEEPKVVVHKVTEKEAKIGAEILADLVDMGNKLALTPLAYWSIRRKKIGTADTLRKMQALEMKKNSGVELTDLEKQQLWRYGAFLKDIERSKNEIPLTDEERTQLIRSAEKYFLTKQINFGGDGSAFWIEFGMIEAFKIMSVISPK